MPAYTPMLLFRLCVACALATPVDMAMAAADRIAGPITAIVVRVVDGDTIEVSAAVWIGLEITVSARIRGIDTPEIRGKCRDETIMAAAAADRLAEAVRSGVVRLTDIEGDKYFGRVVADVTTGEGADVAALMLASGLARVYDGGTRSGWCAAPAVGG